MKEYLITELKQKIEFVHQLSDAIVGNIPGVLGINYEVYVHRDMPNWTQEFLVVDFRGAKSVRNCNGNSLSANIRAIGELIDGGYYRELEFYEGYLNNPEFVRLEDLLKACD